MLLLVSPRTYSWFVSTSSPKQENYQSMSGFVLFSPKLNLLTGCSSPDPKCVFGSASSRAVVRQSAGLCIITGSKYCLILAVIIPIHPRSWTKCPSLICDWCVCVFMHVYLHLCDVSRGSTPAPPALVTRLSVLNLFNTVHLLLDREPLVQPPIFLLFLLISSFIYGCPSLFIVSFTDFSIRSFCCVTSQLSRVLAMLFVLVCWRPSARLSFFSYPNSCSGGT